MKSPKFSLPDNSNLVFTNSQHFEKSHKTIFSVLSINFIADFCPYLGIFVVVVFLSQRFGQISPLAVFRWLTMTSYRNAESCNRIPIHSYPRSLLITWRRPEVKFGRNAVKKIARWRLKSTIKLKKIKKIPNKVNFLFCSHVLFFSSSFNSPIPPISLLSPKTAVFCIKSYVKYTGLYHRFPIFF